MLSTAPLTTILPVIDMHRLKRVAFVSAIHGACSSARKFKLARKRREVRVHVGSADGLKPIGMPARLLVLVDDHRPYSLIKIAPVHKARDYSKLRPHALGETQGRPASHLRERNLETGRRLCPHRASGGTSELRIGAACGRCAVKGCQYVLDALAQKQPINRWPLRRDGPFCRLLRKRPEHRIYGDAVA